MQTEIGIALFAGGLILFVDGFVESLFEKKNVGSRRRFTKGGVRAMVGVFFLVIGILAMWFGLACG